MWIPEPMHFVSRVLDEGEREVIESPLSREPPPSVVELLPSREAPPPSRTYSDESPIYIISSLSSLLYDINDNGDDVHDDFDSVALVALVAIGLY